MLYHCRAPAYSILLKSLFVGMLLYALHNHFGVLMYHRVSTAIGAFVTCLRHALSTVLNLCTSLYGCIRILQYTAVYSHCMLQHDKSTMNAIQDRSALQSVNSVATLCHAFTHGWGADGSLNHRSLTGLFYTDLLSKCMYIKQPRHRFHRQMNQRNSRETSWQADATGIPCSEYASVHHSTCISASQVGRCVCMSALFTAIAKKLVVPLNKSHSTIDINLVIADGQSGSCAAAKVFFESSALWGA